MSAVRCVRFEISLMYLKMLSETLLSLLGNNMEDEYSVVQASNDHNSKFDCNPAPWCNSPALFFAESSSSSSSLPLFEDDGVWKLPTTLVRNERSMETVSWPGLVVGNVDIRMSGLPAYTNRVPFGLSCDLMINSSGHVEENVIFKNKNKRIIGTRPGFQMRFTTIRHLRLNHGTVRWRYRSTWSFSVCHFSLRKKISRTKKNTPLAPKQTSIFQTKWNIPP